MRKVQVSSSGHSRTIFKPVCGFIVLSIMGFWFYQSPSSRAPAQKTEKLNVSLPSKSKGASRAPASVVESVVQPVQTPSVGSIENQNENFEAKIENVRDRLSPETIAWSAKLPQPKTNIQKALWLYVQLARDQDSEIVEILQANSVQFLSVDAASADYFYSLLTSMSAGSDQTTRNFIYQFSKDAFPDRSLGNWMLNDYDLALKNPQNFKSQDQEALGRLILRAPDISWDRKKRLLAVSADSVFTSENTYSK